jgi:hypothetical protein
MGACCTKETAIRAPDQEAAEEPRHVAEVPREADLRSGEVNFHLLSVQEPEENRVSAAEEVQHDEADEKEHSPATVAKLPSSPERNSPSPDNSNLLTPLGTNVYVLPNTPNSSYHCREGCYRKKETSEMHIMLSLGEAIEKRRPPCKKCATDIRT